MKLAYSPTAADDRGERAGPASAVISGGQLGADGCAGLRKVLAFAAAMGACFESTKNGLQ